MLNCVANGCRTTERAKLKIPQRDDRSVNGNPGLDINGDPKWLGTTDSTDLMLKANSQPMLRVGADGNVDVLGQLRLPGLAPSEGEGPVALGIGPFGAVTPMLPCFPRLVGDETIIDNPQWTSGPNKIYTDCGPVNVGIGTSGPESKLDVRGLVKAHGVHTGGLRVGSGAIFENTVAVNTESPLPGAKVDIRGKVAIGYQDGIGPDHANATLDVRADGNPHSFTFETRDNAGKSSLRVRSNGKVVVGDGLFNDSNNGTATLFFGNEDYNIRAVAGEGLIIANTPSWEAIRIPEGTNDVLMPARVSIGTERIVSGPHTNYRLSVDGKIVAKSFNVTTDASYWADYVFQPNYKLRSLPEINEFIKANGHLPDVPTAEDVACEGIDLGAMNATLLRKVEELTLLLIELNEKLNAKCGE